MSCEAACQAAFNSEIAVSMAATSAFLCASFNLPSAVSIAAFLSAGSLSPYSLSCFSVAKMFESAALILSIRSF